MAYLPDAVPGPTPGIEDKPFWDYCQQRELRFQRCAGCGRFRHPPGPACPHCRSMECEWAPAPEAAEVFSYTIVHYPAFAGVRDSLPYNVVIAIFRDCDDVRLISNVIDAEPQEIHIGMALRLTWECAGNGLLVPRFLSKF